MTGERSGPDFTLSIPEVVCVGNTTFVYERDGDFERVRVITGDGGAGEGVYLTERTGDGDRVELDDSWGNPGRHVVMLLRALCGAGKRLEKHEGTSTLQVLSEGDDA